MKQEKKKRVAVITRHFISNYGSLLQALATQKIVEQLGHESQIIDFIRSDEHYKRSARTTVDLNPRWGKSKLKRMAYLVLYDLECRIAGPRFEKEREQLLSMTKRYSSLKELEEDKPEADIYMTGSDQVWGPMSTGPYESAYCLSFTDEKDKRIAYAASIGRTVLTEDLEAYYKKWLGRYQHITVREDSAVKMLANWGIQSKLVLDPTLLFDGDFWSQYITKAPKPGYLLIYQLHNNPRIMAYAKKVAKARGLRIIRFSCSLHQIVWGGKFVFCRPVSEFLGYVKHADLMITDSFHGTAFALNFNTPFVEILPQDSTSTRNMSILTLTGLSDRILRDDNDVALAQRKMDFTHANKVLQEKRRESIQALKQIIEA